MKSGLAKSLVSLCAKVESMTPGAVAGLTICNESQTHIENAIFPSLPYSFSAAITHVPLEPVDFGSCVKAISRGEVITCPDVENDNRFDPRWRKVCLEHGLRAIQSRPITLNGKHCGTFVLGFKEPRSETGFDVALMKFAADAASEALQKNP